MRGRRRNPLRMIGLAAMCGLGLHFNTPEDATGGAGTPAPEAAQPDPTPETLIPADDLLDGVGSFEEETPAEPAAETPETGVDAPAEVEKGEEDGANEPTETPAAPVAETVKPPETPAVATPETPAAPAPAIDPRLTAYDEWKRQAAPLLAKLRNGELDPIDHAEEFKKAHAAVAQGHELLEARQDAIHEYQQAEQQWQSWCMANPDVPMGRARQMFNQAVTETRERLPDAGPQSLQRVATDTFNTRLQAMREAAKAPATPPAAPPASPAAPVTAKPVPPVQPKPAPVGKPKPPVTRGGSMVQPRGTSSTRPPAPSATPEDWLAKNAGGGFKDFL